MSQSYADLLKKVKVGEAPDEQTIAAMRQKAIPVVNDLGTDLSGVHLTDAEVVRQLLEAKFSESGYKDVSLREKETSIEDFVDGSSKIDLASVIIGIYTEAAFNVHVVYEEGKIVVYYSQVPKGGNYR